MYEVQLQSQTYDTDYTEYENVSTFTTKSKQKTQTNKIFHIVLFTSLTVTVIYFVQQPKQNIYMCLWVSVHTCVHAYTYKMKRETSK